MAVKIKLKRLGKIRAPYYRIVVADSRTKRDGRAIEEIGIYHPKENPSRIEVRSERAQYWLGVGAQPTEPVLAILRLTGDWQAYKGEPAPPPLQVKQAGPDRSVAYNAAIAQAASDDGESTRSRGSTARKPRKKAAEAAPAENATAGAGSASSEGAVDAPPPDQTATETDGATEAPAGAGSASSQGAADAPPPDGPATDTPTGEGAETTTSADAEQRG